MKKVRISRRLAMKLMVESDEYGIRQMFWKKYLKRHPEEEREVPPIPPESQSVIRQVVDVEEPGEQKAN